MSYIVDRLEKLASDVNAANQAAADANEPAPGKSFRETLRPIGENLFQASGMATGAVALPAAVKPLVDHHVEVAGGKKVYQPILDEAFNRTRLAQFDAIQNGSSKLSAGLKGAGTFTSHLYKHMPRRMKAALALAGTTPFLGAATGYALTNNILNNSNAPAPNKAN